MVMEYLYGRSFDKWLEQGLPPSHDLRRWLAQLCDALTSIHNAGVVHRDLKPENIWIAEPKTGLSSVKLIDFGISKATGTATLTKVGELAGSPGYMSPERISGTPGDLRSDIYAVGVLLYEIVSGRLPFMADSVVALAVKIKCDPPPPLSPRPGFVLSAKLDALVRDALAKQPEKRPQSALDLKQRLLDALDGQAETVFPVGSIPRFALDASPDSAFRSEAKRPAAGPVQPPIEPDAADEDPGTAAHIAALTGARRRRIAAGFLVVLALAGGGYALWKRGEPASSRPQTAASPTAIAAPPTPAVAPSPAASSPSSPAPTIERVGGANSVRAHARPASARAGGRSPRSSPWLLLRRGSPASHRRAGRHHQRPATVSVGVPATVASALLPGAGGEDIYTIVGCWMRPVSRRVNAQNNSSDAL